MATFDLLEGGGDGSNRRGGTSPAGSQGINSPRQNKIKFARLATCVLNVERTRKKSVSGLVIYLLILVHSSIHLSICPSVLPSILPTV